MKKKLSLFSAVISMVALLVTGTLAYHTVTKEFGSMVKMGNVRLKIHQTDSQGTDVAEAGLSVRPGDEIDRVVTVENTGSQPIFLRLKLVEKMDGNTLPSSHSYITYRVNDNYWEEAGGYFYYKNELASGASTEPLFADNKITIDGSSMTVEELGKSFYFDVQAYGVQSKNNGTSSLDAKGWPEEIQGGESR